MTRALEVESHDTATSSTMASRTDEPLDQIFSFRELARLDERLLSDAGISTYERAIEVSL